MSPPPPPPNRQLATSEEALLQALGLEASGPQLQLAPTIHQGTQEWHLLRLLRLTGSELAAAVGANPHCTPEQLVSRKLEALADFLAGRDPSHGFASAQQQSNMQYGSASEPLAAMSYFSSAPVGAQMQQTGFHIHRAHHWLGSSPDRIIRLPTGSTGLLEIKCPASKVLPTELPRHVLLQALAQLASQPPGADWQWVDVFYWTPAGSRTWRVHWDSTTQQEWQHRILPLAHCWFFTQFAPAALQSLQQLSAVPKTPACAPARPAQDPSPTPTPACNSMPGQLQQQGRPFMLHYL
jgi:putative phage-type endonuclease